MGNIALNKQATASNSILPYVPSRAVDGNLAASNRWVSGQVPTAMTVDLGASFLVNRWVVKHPAIITAPAGWSAPDYANSDFKLQGSNNQTSWVDLDTVVNNTASITDRTISPAPYRYFRLAVTKGLQINNQTTSVMEFELYQAYSAALTNLAISAGTLTPPFNTSIFAYTATVEASVSSINVTPTAFSPTAVVKVNNVTVGSGSATPVALAFGTTNIVVNVTDGTLMQNYTLVVTRAGNANLSSLIVKDNTSAIVPLSPAFDKTMLNYTVKTDSDATTVTFTPTVEDTQATVKVNGTAVGSGQTSSAFPIGSGITVPIEVTSNLGNKQTYNMAVSKNTSAYLTSVTLVGRTAPLWNTPFVRKTLSYNVTAYTTSLTATVKKEDAAATLYVTCNGIVLNPTSSSGDTAVFSVSLNAGSNSMVIRVTSTSGDVKTYTFSITK
jgi:hypothetical protein